MVAAQSYFVQAFRRAGSGLEPGPVRQCFSAAAARTEAQKLAAISHGAIAWAAFGDPDIGKFGPPEVLLRVGETPEKPSV